MLGIRISNDGKLPLLVTAAVGAGIGALIGGGATIVFSVVNGANVDWKEVERMRYIGHFKNSVFTWVYLYGAIFWWILVTVFCVILMCIEPSSEGAGTCIYISIILILFFIPLIYEVISVYRDDTYKMIGDTISFYRTGKKGNISIDQIKTIVVTNHLYRAGGYLYAEHIRNERGVKVVLPLISLYTADIREISAFDLDYPMYNGTLDEYAMEHPEKDYVYKFLYNEKIQDIFLKQYRGKIYIARTVYENYKDEIALLYQKWEYTSKAITIIKDKNNENFRRINSPYMAMEER